MVGDLRKIYQAATETEGLKALDELQTRWEKKYPMIIRSWRSNWDKVRPMYTLPSEIRKAVYTTNIIESLNFSLRKIIKGRAAFPHDEAVYRLIWMGLQHVERRWTMPIRNWKQALQQLALLYEDRVPLDALSTVVS